MKALLKIAGSIILFLLKFAFVVVCTIVGAIVGLVMAIA